MSRTSHGDYRWAVLTWLAITVMAGQAALVLHDYEHDLAEPVVDCEQCRLAPVPDGQPSAAGHAVTPPDLEESSGAFVSRSLDRRPHTLKRPRAPPSRRH